MNCCISIHLINLEWPFYTQISFSYIARGIFWRLKNEYIFQHDPILDDTKRWVQY